MRLGHTEKFVLWLLWGHQDGRGFKVLSLRLALIEDEEGRRLYSNRGVLAAALSRSLRSLEKKGLVGLEFEGRTKGARVRGVRLTQMGEEVFEAMRLPKAWFDYSYFEPPLRVGKEVIVG